MEGPIERLTLHRPIETPRRVPTEPRTPAGLMQADLERGVTLPHHPNQLVGGARPSASDAGPQRSYAEPSSAELPSEPSSPPAASEAAGSTGSEAVSVEVAAVSSTAPGTSSAPSAPCDHSVADTAVPPSAGCQTISPDSFWIHSPSAHSSPAYPDSSSASCVSLLMSIRQPVNLAANRAF